MVIGKVIKYGGLFLIAKEGIKAFEKRNDNQDRSRDHQIPHDIQTQAQPTSNWRNGNDYIHQAYCNGQCDSRCNGPPAYKEPKM
jgi:hypothetical protein